MKVKEYKRIIGNNIIAIISIQMSLLYLHAGIEKIYKLDDWVEGTAIYYIFNDSLLPIINKYINFLNMFFKIVHYNMDTNIFHI